MCIRFSFRAGSVLPAAGGLRRCAAFANLSSARGGCLSRRGFGRLPRGAASEDSGELPDEFFVNPDSLPDLREEHVFVGRVGARRLSRTHFERRKGHQGHVRRGGGRRSSGVWRPAQRVRAGVRRRAPRRGCVSSGHGLGAQCPAQDFDCLLVGVGVGRAQIDDEAARVGHDVVLGAGRDLRDGDADRPQQFGYAVEAEAAEPRDVVECDIERIYALVARRMAAFCRGLRSRGPPAPARRRRPACPSVRRRAPCRSLPSCGSRARMPCSPMHSSSAERASRRLKGRGCSRKVRNVRASDTTEAPASLLPRPYKRSPSMVGGERVARIGGRRAHRVVVRVQQEGGARRVEVCGAGEDVVVQPFGRRARSSRKANSRSAVRLSSREGEGVAMSLLSSSTASVVFASMLFRFFGSGGPPGPPEPGVI